MIKNKTLRRILLFLLIFMLINQGIKLYFFKVSVRNHMLVKQERNFENYQGKIDFLFLGHSRPGRAIDTSKIDNSYLYCSGGESVVYTYYKLKYLLEKNPDRISTIALPIGLTTAFINHSDKNTNSFYWSKYVDYMELGEATGEYSNYLSLYLKSALFPYFEYPYIRITESFDELRLPMEEATFQQASEKARINMGTQIIEHQLKFRSFYDSVAIQYIDKTIALVKQYDKQLIYIKYPVTTYYAQALDNHDAKMTLIQQSIEESLMKDSAILYIDFQQRFLNHPEYFKDTHHLNDKGRDLFTDLLVELLKKENILH